MSSNRDQIESLLDEAANLEDEFQEWQVGAPPAQQVIRDGKRRFDSWFARAKRVVPEDRRDEFIDMYNGGTFTTRIRGFLTDPLAVSPFYNEDEPNPLVGKWTNDFQSAFRDSFVRQMGILSEALESDLDVARALESLAAQMARLPEFLATFRHYDNDNVPSPNITRESDLQVVVHGILRILYEDVREEDPVSKRAGASSRVDFSIPEIGVVVETKMTRPGLTDKKVGEELLIDWGRYAAYEGCEGILAIVYDPDRYIRNAAALESDLSQRERSPATLVKIVR